MVIKCVHSSCTLIVLNGVLNKNTKVSPFSKTTLRLQKVKGEPRAEMPVVKQRPWFGNIGDAWAAITKDVVWD